MKLFHGTSHNRLMKILKDGYLGCDESVWNVSQSQTTYFWSQREIYEIDDHAEEEDAYHEAFRYALESAEIALGGETKNMRRAVIVIDEHSLKLIEEGELRGDESCDTEYAVQFDVPIPVEKIEKVYIDKSNLDLFGLYFIGLVYILNERRQPTYKAKEADLPDRMKCLAKKVYQELVMDWYDTQGEIENLEEFTITKGVLK